MASAKREALSISGGVKGGYGGSPGRLTNSSTPTISPLARSGVASNVIVLNPVRRSASDQKEPSLDTSATAIGWVVEKTKPAIPAPGGRRKANNSSETPLVAVRNFKPPSSPSRTSTDATAEPTDSAAKCKSSSIARLSATARQCETSIWLMTSATCAAEDLILAPAFGDSSSLLSGTCSLILFLSQASATNPRSNG